LTLTASFSVIKNISFFLIFESLIYYICALETEQDPSVQTK